VTAPVLTLSNVTRDGVAALEQTLLPAKTYCFVGSSGVGKSTLINHLIGREQLLTKGVSETGEGRHTTVRRELIVLTGGALVIDNPGMREFGVLDAEAGIATGFADIDGLASACRYRNCGHTGEPGCAVLAAVNAGALGREHYDNYLALREESKFSRMSPAEKRKKDRAFGRLVKSAKKDLAER
jgi:ribosome biogenesis GTPase